MSTVLCVGEPLVDLIAEGPAAPGDERPRYSPHFGGAIAVAAVTAARAGARVSLAGAVGGDRWGPWLRERLTAEGVDDAWLVTRPDAGTGQAVVKLAPDGQPDYTLREAPAPAAALALGADPAPALHDATGLLIGTDTLAAADDRAATMRAREQALSAAKPVVLAADPRLARWSSRTDAIASINPCLTDALLVVAAPAAAQLLTGESDPERAAQALRKAGARLAAITLGRDGGLVRGPSGLRVDVRGRGPRPPGGVAWRSGVGATAVFTGTLVAALERSGFYPDAAAAALDDAVAAVVRTGTHWGALD